MALRRASALARATVSSCSLAQMHSLLSLEQGDGGKKIGVSFIANAIGWFSGGLGEEKTRTR